MLTLFNVTKKYYDNVVLKDFSLNVEKGKIVGIIGPSGCGKSTLLKIVSGLEGYNEGEVIKNYKRLGFIFQEPTLLNWATVFNNVEVVIKDRIKDPLLRRKKVEEVLDRVEMLRFKNYYPPELSGGMKQRVSIARALVIDPDFLIMDEPFSNLDLRLRINIIKDLKRIFEDKNITGIFVTHDYREAYLLCDEIYIMNIFKGKLVEKMTITTNKDNRCFNDEEFYNLDEKVKKHHLLITDKNNKKVLEL